MAHSERNHRAAKPAALGIPEKLSILLGLPFLLVVLWIDMERVVQGLSAEPLPITSLLNLDIFVQWSVDPGPFLVSLLFHMMLIAALTALLLIQYRKARTWLCSVRHRTGHRP